MQLSLWQWRCRHRPAAPGMAVTVVVLPQGSLCPRAREGPAVRGEQPGRGQAAAAPVTTSPGSARRAHPLRLTGRGSAPIRRRSQGRPANGKAVANTPQLFLARPALAHLAGLLSPPRWGRPCSVGGGGTQACGDKIVREAGARVGGGVSVPVLGPRRWPCRSCSPCGDTSWPGLALPRCTPGRCARSPPGCPSASGIGDPEGFATMEGDGIALGTSPRAPPL